MSEHLPSLRRALPAAALAGSLALGISACGTEQAPSKSGRTATAVEPGAPGLATSPSDVLTPPAIPTPQDTESHRLKRKEITDGVNALVCNALAAIANPDGTKRPIGRPIVWDLKDKAPVEIMDLEASGINVEQRDPQITEWYSLNGKKIDVGAVACSEQPVFTMANNINHNQVVTTTDVLPTNFHADADAVHNKILAQHDFGPYNRVEFDGLLNDLAHGVHDNR
jgi:hypothetical protein